MNANKNININTDALKIFTSETSVTGGRFVSVSSVTALWISRAKPEISKEGQIPCILERLCEDCPEAWINALLQEADLKTIRCLQVVSRAWLHFISPCNLLTQIKSLNTCSDLYQKLTPEIQRLCSKLSNAYDQLTKTQPLHTLLSSKVAMFFKYKKLQPSHYLTEKINFAEKENIEISIPLSIQELIHPSSRINQFQKNRLKLKLNIEKVSAEDLKKIVLFFSSEDNKKWINAIDTIELNFPDVAFENLPELETVKGFTELTKAIFKNPEWFSLGKLSLNYLDDVLQDSLFHLVCKEAYFEIINNKCTLNLPHLETLTCKVISNGTTINHLCPKLKTYTCYWMRENTTINLSGLSLALENFTFSSINKGGSINLSNSLLLNLKALNLPKGLSDFTINLSKSSLGLKKLVFETIGTLGTLNITHASLPNLEEFSVRTIGNDATVDLFNCSLPKVRTMYLGHENIGRNSTINLYNAWLPNLEKFFLGCIDRTRFRAPKEFPKLEEFHVKDIASEFDISECSFPELKLLHLGNLNHNADVKLPEKLLKLKKFELATIDEDAKIELPKFLPELEELHINKLANGVVFELTGLYELKMIDLNIMLRATFKLSEAPKLEKLYLGEIRNNATIELPQSLPNLNELSLGQKKAVLTIASNGLKSFTIPNASKKEAILLKLINSTLN